MISLLVYKFFHITGIMMVFLSLGGAMVYAINGGDKASNQWRKGVAILRRMAGNPKSSAEKE